MPAIIEGPPEPGDAPRPLWRRLSWFFAIALGSALAAAVIAYGMKALLPS